MPPPISGDGCTAPPISGDGCSPVAPWSACAPILLGEGLRSRHSDNPPAAPAAAAVPAAAPEDEEAPRSGPEAEALPASETDPAALALPLSG
jgi:hypothetical protein